MNTLAIGAAKAAIGALLAALVAIQFWVVPELARGFARIAPEFAHLEVPGVVIVGLFVACIEVVLVCLWRLLSMVAARRIFTDAAFAWVDAVIASIVAAVALIVIGSATLSWAQAGNPLTLLLAALGVIAGTGAALVVWVMRSLLRRATTLEHELSEVV